MLAKSGSKVALERLDALNSNLADFHKKDPAYDLAARTVTYSVAATRGDAPALAAAYAEMQKTHAAAVAAGHELDREQSMFMLEAAVKRGDEKTACAMAGALYDDHIGNQSVEDRVQEIMAGGGWKQQAMRIAEGASENLRRMNSAAADMAKHGRLLEAVEEFARLAEANPAGSKISLLRRISSSMAIGYWPSKQAVQK